MPKIGEIEVSQVEMNYIATKISITNVMIIMNLALNIFIAYTLIKNSFQI